LLSLGLAACSSTTKGSPSGGGSNHNVYVVGVLSEFTGADAGYGQEGMAGCIPAVDLINAAGGVLGHKLSCQQFDTKSDPADAVPEVHQMLATTSDLLMSMGTGGNTAPAVIPLLNAAKVTTFTDSGQSLFNINSYPYFWRDVPVDASQGYAMAIATVLLGYTHASAVFGQNVSSQGSLPSFVAGMKLLGHPVSSTVVLPTAAPSYSAQVANIQSSHATAVVGEVDPSSAATFFSELKQVLGSVPPLVGDQAYDEASWLTAVEGAIGASTLRSQLSLVLPVASATGPGFLAFRKALLASATPSKTTYVTDSYSAADYDSVVLAALAADEAKSLVPAVYNQDILSIANGVPGAVVVHTYAEGLAAIAKGEKIHYLGASGSISFDRYHNWGPGYVIAKLTTSGVRDIRLVPPNVLHDLLIGHHATA
jgi:branched-chain amino acid transport system substrate-binding protein